MFNPLGGGSKAPSPSKNDQLNKSFTELLIQYVESESKPKPQIKFDLTQPSSPQTLLNKKNDAPLLMKPQFDRSFESQALTATSASAAATTNRFINTPSTTSNANNKFLEDALS